MNWLEFLDARHARKMAYRMEYPPRQIDAKLGVGALFLAGYYALVFVFSRIPIPIDNVGLVRDAMLVLGPPVGAIVAALWRTDRRDEEATRNTGEVLRTMQAQATATTAVAANTASGLNDPARPTGTADDPVHTSTE